MQGSLSHEGKLFANTSNNHPKTWRALFLTSCWSNASVPTGSVRDAKHCSMTEDSSKLQLNNTRKQLDNNCMVLLNMRTLRRTWRWHSVFKRCSEARFSAQQRELLSRVSTEASDNFLVREAMAEKQRERINLNYYMKALENIRQELRASQQAVTANQSRGNFRLTQLQEEKECMDSPEVMS